MEAGLAIDRHLVDFHVGDMFGLKVGATAIGDEAITDVIDIADAVLHGAISIFDGGDRAEGERPALANEISRGVGGMPCVGIATGIRHLQVRGRVCRARGHRERVTQGHLSAIGRLGGQQWGRRTQVFRRAHAHRERARVNDRTLRGERAVRRVVLHGNDIAGDGLPGFRLRGDAICPDQEQPARVQIEGREFVGTVMIDKGDGTVELDALQDMMLCIGELDLESGQHAGTGGEVSMQFRQRQGQRPLRSGSSGSSFGKIERPRRDNDLEARSLRISADQVNGSHAGAACGRIQKGAGKCLAHRGDAGWLGTGQRRRGLRGRVPEREGL